MTRDDTVWLAGVFDSRGSAVFVEAGPTAKRHRGNLMVSIQCGRHPGLLDEIRRVVGGGSVYMHRQRPTDGVFPQKMETPAWSCSSRRARELLKSLLPYIRIRREMIQAALAIDAQRINPDYHRPQL